ncbi:spore cortex-lytic enzyme [Caminicella sporogenes]|uniref:spore cortex-lytic enzyme n=1 Tax=Caminicella sporogenes TaxID=166485 RepID=UPI0025409A73|nr:spore cortex-lytic enzyme [Caminicella sporogenes]WIF94215.1 spore cortex-lytic enzyme [Caminicella sporogenes]
MKKQFNVILCIFTIFLIVGIFYIDLSYARTLYWGVRGEDVKEVQRKLKYWGYYYGEVDGIYGPQTFNAVKKFQRKNKLKVDGIVGSQTKKAMGISDKKLPSYSREVEIAQKKLKQWGYYKGPIDGIYGSKTYIAVVNFQRKNGLKVDGYIGPQTRKALGITIKAVSRGYLASSRGITKEDDIRLLAMAINGESRGEPYVGQVAVGAVILNRVKHPSFPNSIAGVIYQPLAFESVDTGQIYAPITESSYRAARDALNGWDPTGGALYFFNPAKAKSKWVWTLKPIIKIGKHVFAKK